MKRPLSLRPTSGVTRTSNDADTAGTSENGQRIEIQIDRAGSIQSWGGKYHGELGGSSTTDSSVQDMLSDSANRVAVAAGHNRWPELGSTPRPNGEWRTS
jgi:hypothetical protein